MVSVLSPQAFRVTWELPFGVGGCEHQGQRPNRKQDKKGWVIKTLSFARELKLKPEDKLLEGHGEVWNDEGGGKSFQEHLPQQSEQTMLELTTGPLGSTQEVTGVPCNGMWQVSSILERLHPHMWVLGLSRTGLKEARDLLTPLLRGTSCYKGMQIDFRQYCLSESPQLQTHSSGVGPIL